MVYIASTRLAPLLPGVSPVPRVRTQCTSTYEGCSVDPFEQVGTVSDFYDEGMISKHSASGTFGRLTHAPFVN